MDVIHVCTDTYSYYFVTVLPLEFNNRNENCHFILYFMIYLGYLYAILIIFGLFPLPFEVACDIFFNLIAFVQPLFIYIPI